MVHHPSNSCVAVATLDTRECIMMNHENGWILPRECHHPSDTAECPHDMMHFLFSYRNPSGQHQVMNIAQVEKLMACIYTSRLMFQSKVLLRNYPFWGYSHHESDETLFPSSMDAHISALIDVGYTHADLEIQHVPEMNDELGLFTSQVLAKDTFMGEYTGLVAQDMTDSCQSDRYGVDYPNCHARHSISLSAMEHGNIMRCINHSSKPNVVFQMVIHRGILHLVVRTIGSIQPGEQLFVDYGEAYWHRLGIVPI